MLQQTYAHRLDANMLKLIAILAMTADHLAWLLFPGYSTVPIALFLHVIGRLTCPIMCYFIAEGYHYTRSVRNMRRGCLSSLLSRILPISSRPAIMWTHGPSCRFRAARFLIRPA